MSSNYAGRAFESGKVRIFEFFYPESGESDFLYFLIFPLAYSLNPFFGRGKMACGEMAWHPSN
jgi:hypothetical protein